MKENKYLYKGEFKEMSGVILESRGGAKASNQQRNPDYKLLRQYVLELLKTENRENVEIYVASNRESLYPTMESRLITIDGVSSFNFGNLKIVDFDRKLNEAVRRAGQTDVISGGNDTKRLFFHIKSADAFLTKKTIASTTNSTVILGSKAVEKTLEQFTYTFKRPKNNSKELKSIVADLQDKLFNYLQETYTDFSWEKEFKGSRLRSDSFDIYGVNKSNEQHIIVELDPHRADSIAKKFVSRLAIMNQYNLIYIAFLYPGTDNMPINEAKKYLEDCETLCDIMSTPDNKKEFLGYFLNK